MSKFDATICFNAKAKQADKGKLAEIKRIFKNYGINCNAINPLRLASTPAQKLGSLLVAVGGDGTVHFVAAAALAHDRALAVIPQGTFNHFAKDIGMPLDAHEAAQSVAVGAKRKVDTGQVNDQIFLNNSVVGFYPHLIAKRERLQGKIGKWLALAVAASLMLTKIKRYRLTLRVNDKTMDVRTSLLVIANNRYDISGLGLASRKKLDEGKLYVYVVKSKTLPEMFGVSLRLLAGKATSKDFDCYKTDQLEVGSRKTTLRVAVDGETIQLRTPLMYKIYPKSLKIIA